MQIFFLFIDRFVVFFGFFIDQISLQLKDPSQPLVGSTHGLDLVYVFDKTRYFDAMTYYAYVGNGDDAPVYDVFRRMLTSFAKTGRAPKAGLNAPVWPRYDLDRQYYMALKSQPEVRQKVYAQRVALWSEFLPKLHSDAFSSWPSDFRV